MIERNYNARTLFEAWAKRERTRAVSDLCREIASVAPLVVLNECDPFNRLHRHDEESEDGSLAWLVGRLDWEVADGE